MKYAVIKTGGKQYKVQEGKTIQVEKLPIEKDKPVEFDEVLLLVDDEKVAIGQPKLEEKVVGKVVDQLKSKKLVVMKYKAKTGYRRKQGHRQQVTKVLIEKIGGRAKKKKKAGQK